MEAVAVVLSLAYTWGYLQGWTPWCFAPAAIGSGLLAWLCWQRNIQAEAALQGFYVAFAFYGAWLSGGAQDWTPKEATVGFHIAATAAATAATLWLARTLRKRTQVQCQAGMPLPRFLAFGPRG